MIMIDRKALVKESKENILRGLNFRQIYECTPKTIITKEFLKFRCNYRVCRDI